MSTMCIEYILENFKFKRGVICVIPNVRGTRQNKYRNISTSKLRKKNRRVYFLADSFCNN